jgi:glycosyltransferase involved in cell wall biosynthesis
VALDRPVRIAFVLHAMQVAGVEVLVAETICRLGSKIDPVVLCLDGVGELGARLQTEGIPVLDMGRRPGLDLGVPGRLADEISRRGIEVVHAHQYTPFFYSALAKLRSFGSFHLIFTEHGRHYPDAVSAKRRLANRWLLNRCANEINAVCRFSAQALSEIDGFPASRIEILDNGIDAKRYTPTKDRIEVRKRLGLDPNRCYILCVARFHPVKDHAMLLSAFSTVAAEKPDVDLLLAGDGPLRQIIEQQVFGLHLQQRVRFLGVRSDVADLMQASDVFTLTSVSEAASLTLMEAMASALPAVVTDVGGNPEIIRSGTEGLLVPRGDAASLSNALLRLLSDAAFAGALAEKGRRRVLERYSLDRTVMNYYQRYATGASRVRGHVS